MINSDAVDFSERRPEEVISFFWRSVYIHNSHAHHARTQSSSCAWTMNEKVHEDSTCMHNDVKRYLHNKKWILISVAIVCS